MATVAKILANGRLRLGNPSRATLTDNMLLQYLYDWHQHYAGMLKTRSDEAIMLQRFPLVITGGTDEYPLGALAPTFGGSLVVLTDPSQYEDQRQREVTVVRIQDLDISQANYWTDGQSLDNDSVEVMCFYSDGTQWWAKVLPRGASGSYIVWYEPVLAPETSLDNTPVIPAGFHNLLTVRMCVDAVSDCTWEGMPPEMQAAKRGEKRTMLLQAQEEMEREFRNAILEACADDTGDRIMFSSSPGVWSGYRNGGW